MTQFDAALNDFLRRYNGHLDDTRTNYIFPYGVDVEGPVTYDVPVHRLRTIDDINKLDDLFQDIGFLSSP